RDRDRLAGFVAPVDECRLHPYPHPRRRHRSRADPPAAQRRPARRRLALRRRHGADDTPSLPEQRTCMLEALGWRDSVKLSSAWRIDEARPLPSCLERRLGTKRRTCARPPIFTQVDAAAAAHPSTFIVRTQEGIMQAPVILGIDVARGELVVAREGSTGAVQHVRNDADSIRRWLEALAPGSVVAMESSVRYHRLLADLAHAKGMCVYVLNAHDVHQYARVGTPRAKTDRLDAIVIAHYVREHRTSLRRWQPPAGVSEALRRLLDQRAMLTRQLVAVRQS